MEVGELMKLYQQAQEVRDESARKLLAQSVAQAAAAQEALRKAKENTHDEMGAALADRAHAELAAFDELSEEAVRSWFPQRRALACRRVARGRNARRRGDRLRDAGRGGERGSLCRRAVRS